MQTKFLFAALYVLLLVLITGCEENVRHTPEVDANDDIVVDTVITEIIDTMIMLDPKTGEETTVTVSSYDTVIISNEPVR